MSTTTELLAKTSRIQAKLETVIADSLFSFDAEELIWHPNQIVKLLPEPDEWSPEAEARAEFILNAAHESLNGVNAWALEFSCWNCGYILRKEEACWLGMCLRCSLTEPDEWEALPRSTCYHDFPELCADLPFCTRRGQHNQPMVREKS